MLRAWRYLNRNYLAAGSVLAFAVLAVALVVSERYAERREVLADIDFVRQAALISQADPGEVYASFAQLNLKGAHLPGLIFAFTDIDFSGSDLSGAVLVKSDLSMANLSETALVGADLSAADLGEALLSASDLSGAKLVETNLRGANLGSAVLRKADLSGAALTDAALAGADLSGATLANADLFGTDLAKADLSNARLERVNMADASLLGADLSGADLSGANLSGADLSGAKVSDDVSAGGSGAVSLCYDDFTTWPEGFTPPPRDCGSWPESLH